MTHVLRQATSKELSKDGSNVGFRCMTAHTSMGTK
jgi:hypothetical protein